MNLFVLIFLMLSCIASAEPYKLYCMYTPDFQPLYETYFLPSIQDDFQLVVRQVPQECPSGLFRSDGWDQTMLRKLEMVRDAIEENWGGQIFFYSDIDIVFLRPILEESLKYLGDRDFVIQQSFPRNTLCAGFFIMRGNEKTWKLIQTAYCLLQEKKCVDDQIAIQTALASFEEGEISWALLPSEKFPNGRRILKETTGYYSVDSELKLDYPIFLFHATSCIGLENKYHFLSRVQNEVFKGGAQK